MKKHRFPRIIWIIYLIKKSTMHVEKLYDIGQHSIHGWHSTAIQVWGNFSWHGSVFTVTLLINWSYLLMIAWRIADCLTVIAFIFLTTTCSVIFGNLKLDINVMMILNRLNGYAFGRSANVNTNRRPYTLSVACLGSNTANASEQSVVGSWVRRICSTTSRTPSGCPSTLPTWTQCMMISANSSGWWCTSDPSLGEILNLLSLSQSPELQGHPTKSFSGTNIFLLFGFEKDIPVGCKSNKKYKNYKLYGKHRSQKYGKNTWILLENR